MVLIRYRTINGEDEYEWYSVRKETVEEAVQPGKDDIYPDSAKEPQKVKTPKSNVRFYSPLVRSIARKEKITPEFEHNEKKSIVIESISEEEKEKIIAKTESEQVKIEEEKMKTLETLEEEEEKLK